MARRKTPWAEAAALIRKELKKHGIKARVTSDSGSMTSSVNVALNNELPATVKKIEAFCRQFEMGHFDGMIDLYEMSNVRDDIPQVKFVFVRNSWDDEWMAKAWAWLKANFSGLEEAPEDWRDAGSFRFGSDWGNTWIWRCLSGDYGVGEEFWREHKPRIAA